jgi:SAM-dependent methyltransferase
VPAVEQPRFKDHFSQQAAYYAKFRPRYPDELFEYLATIAPGRELAWDCATGNGQAAVGLARVFNRVTATDASEKQIANAEPHERVEYYVATAENCKIDSGKVDAVVVAQALHWFELDRFYMEVKRVLKPAGIIGATAYNLLHVAPAIDAVVNRYYYEIVGPFWPRERALVENFAELPFPFEKIDAPQFRLEANWNLEYLLGYLRSWSSTQRYMAAKQHDPLELIVDELRAAWGDPTQLRHVVWPLTLRLGRID